MPYKPKQYCKYPGCNELVDSGYCDKHKPPVSQSEIDRHRHDNTIYTYTWRKLRRMQLNREPLCHDCLEIQRVTAATEVHHIKAVSDGGGNELSNLMSLCKSCHSKRTFGNK